MSYPPLPHLRVAYDRNGCIGFVTDITAHEWKFPYSGSFPVEFGTQFGSGTLRQINDETNLDAALLPASRGSSQYVGIWFPCKYDIYGYYMMVGSGSGMSERVEVSTDTSNGMDGSWTALRSGASGGSDIWSWSTGPIDYRDYRTSIQTLMSPAMGIRGIRFWMSQDGFLAGTISIFMLHLYGRPSDGQVLHMLAPWHPTLDQWADGTTLDFSDIGQGVSQQLPFRVKNLSPSFIAHGTIISEEALTDSVPSLSTQVTLSNDAGVTFNSTVNLGDLTPGAVSSQVIVKNSVAATEEVGPWAFRFPGISASWL